MIPLDPETKAGLRRMQHRPCEKEYQRVTRNFLPLLRAAMAQPHPTSALTNEIGRLHAQLPDDLLAELQQEG